MRAWRAAACGAACVVLGFPGVAAQSDADAVVAAMHAALGGAARLAAVQTVVASGRTRRVRGDNLVPIEFQIAMELPDRYVRQDEFPGQDTPPAVSGFDRDTLLQRPPQRDARVAVVKHDAARLLLGFFGGAVSPVPLTFRAVGVAEAPQGRADVLDVSGGDGFGARLFVDATTHLPVMVTWTSGEKDQPRESRFYFADFRNVDGLKWPFRVRRAIGTEPQEETTFDRFRVNVRIDAGRFEVR